VTFSLLVSKDGMFLGPSGCQLDEKLWENAGSAGSEASTAVTSAARSILVERFAMLIAIRRLTRNKRFSLRLLFSYLYPRAALQAPHAARRRQLSTPQI
jgi:hypothetical protein